MVIDASGDARRMVFFAGAEDRRKKTIKKYIYRYIYNIHIYLKIYIDKMWRTNHIIIFCTVLWSVYGQQQQKNSENENEDDELKSHRRSKRFLWMTHEKRLVLPVRNFDE